MSTQILTPAHTVEVINHLVSMDRKQNGKARYEILITWPDLTRTSYEVASLKTAHAIFNVAVSNKPIGANVGLYDNEPDHEGWALLHCSSQIGGVYTNREPRP